jgi:hypothetical protein
MAPITAVLEILVMAAVATAAAGILNASAHSFCEGRFGVSEPWTSTVPTASVGAAQIG